MFRAVGCLHFYVNGGFGGIESTGSERDADCANDADSPAGTQHHEVTGDINGERGQYCTQNGTPVEP